MLLKGQRQDPLFSLQGAQSRERDAAGSVSAVMLPSLAIGLTVFLPLGNHPEALLP